MAPWRVTMDDASDATLEGGWTSAVGRRGFLQAGALGLTAAVAPLSGLSAIVQAAGTPTEAGVVRGGALRVGVPERFTGFDPYGQRSRTDYQATDNIFDRLVTYDAHYVPRPMLAESWSNPDAATWVFKLRRGVT